ncbi:Bug family tripartite tricarboxylate transporter substrate binding protein [Acrocarpospora catenulata]|uniref:Bug family tripartite tricarboxylate transporter substrate binding protein n=1 Tax=Acrocarpospora catenulata TaxID=2836182 RepID=UPI001BD93509|nr:tripartite tricarboxylate transporter substrate-binding protein [Acrocarpospora catenulata]
MISERISRRGFVLGLGGAALAVATGCARENGATTETMGADALAAVWSGKTLKLICSEAPGGSLDNTCRMLGRHLGKHLPGNPTVVVENMAGGESRIATNHVYGAKGDGLTIGMTDINIPFYTLLGEGPELGVRWDPDKIPWLGSTSKAPQVLAVHKRTGIQKGDLAAVAAKNLRLPYGAVGDGPHTGHVLLNELLKLNLRPIFGYGGSSARMLGLDRGEVDGTVSTWDSLLRQKGSELADGTLIPMVQIGGPIDHATMQGVPTVADLTKDSAEADKNLLKVVADRYEWARPLMAPADVSPPVLEALRKALADTLVDPALLEEAKKIGIDIEPSTGTQVQERIAEYLKTPKDTVDRLQKLIKADGA